MAANRSIQFALWTLAICALGYVMGEAATIFMWIVVSFFLFALLDPVTEFMKKRNLSTIMASSVAVVAGTLIAGGIIYVVAHLSHNMVIELEDSKKIFVQYFNQLDQKWRSINDSVKHLGVAGQPAAQTAAPSAAAGGSPLEGMGGMLMGGVSSAVTLMTFAVLTPFLTFFFLADRDLFARVFAKLYSNPTTGRKVWERIVLASRAFFIGNLVIGAVSFPVFLIIFLLFGIPQSATLAVLSSLFNLVPFLGAVLTGLLPALTLLGQGDHAFASLLLYACCVVAHLAVANFVTPKVLGSKVDINSTTSMIALVGLGELWGAVGLILGIPIMAAIKIVFEYSGSEWLQWIASLMSEGKQKMDAKPAAIPESAAPSMNNREANAITT